MASDIEQLTVQFALALAPAFAAEYFTKRREDEEVFATTNDMAFALGEMARQCAEEVIDQEGQRTATKRVLSIQALQRRLQIGFADARRVQSMLWPATDLKDCKLCAEQINHPGPCRFDE